MEIHLFDSGQVPQPKDKIKIEDLKAIPYPDRFRVFVEVKVTPFRDRPNLVLALRDANDRVVSELSIIETMHANMEFTMHIRGVTDPAGEYTVTAEMFYETRTPPQDLRTVSLTIEPAQNG